jgi:hypothetical protein
MLIGDIFEKNVTRDIPPVVYFHEQTPAKLADEVGEYIITGGYGKNDPRVIRNDGGIHEQFVRLLTAMQEEMRKPGGAELPAVWISGFYGSGKSSFAKLLGLALDGVALPNRTLLSEALLARDSSPERQAFADAWHKFCDAITQPISVVFDVGSAARDNEHIHSVVLRECQKRFGYCPTSHHVADFELSLETDGEYPAFLDRAAKVLGRPWSEVMNKKLAEDHFSEVMHHFRSTTYKDPMSWLDSRAGAQKLRSPEEAVTDIAAMMSKRYPQRTLFLVVDEVSQYVHDNEDRMLRLQSFVSALGQRLKGGAWLLATGQQKLEDGAAAKSPLSKLKDRFPDKLRVHLGTANIRDVVHKRLLAKRPSVVAELRDLFQQHRADLSLYSFKGDEVSESDFIDIYPMLPGHIDLLLAITTGLRARSSRIQGDSHAIRGLLQLLGEIFRYQGSAFTRYELGHLITIDRIFDVLHTSLDSDIQTTLNRALEFCSKQQDSLAARAVKAVSLLELISEEKKTDADLISRCLYEKLGSGSQIDAVQLALDKLKAEGLLGYSEKSGYKIQSTAGEEWQRERDDYLVGDERLSEEIQTALKWLLGDVKKVALEGMPLPWQAFFSDSLGTSDARINKEANHTVVNVDFRFVSRDERKPELWVPRSDTVFPDRIIWVAGETDDPRQAARKLVQSARLVERYEGREATLVPEKQRLLIEERNRKEALAKDLKAAVEAAFISGTFYFRGRQQEARDVSVGFAQALEQFAQRNLSAIYPHPVTYSVTQKDIDFLIDNRDLQGPPQVFGQSRLGILILDAGRYEASCEGVVPSAISKLITSQSGITGSSLLEHFGSPPHGYTADIVRACLVGLLRGHKIRARAPGIGEITSVRDEGTRELFADRNLRKAEFFINGDETLAPRDKAAICRLFQEHFNEDVQRDNDAIADAVAKHFVRAREWLTDVEQRFRKLGGAVDLPPALVKLGLALENCRASRQVEPTVKAVKRNLDSLRDGLHQTRRLLTDLSDEAIAGLRSAQDVLNILVPQLQSAYAGAGQGEAEKNSDAHLMFKQNAGDLKECLEAPQAWTNLVALQAHAKDIRKEYEAARKAILDGHQTQIEAALDAMKRRKGFDTLNPDQQHQVLRSIREGAALQTSVTAVAPGLEVLDVQFAQQLARAEQRALATLDGLLEEKGQPATVTVDLGWRGREISTEQDLQRFLAEVEARIRGELAAKHKVRLQ